MDAAGTQALSTRSLAVPRTISSGGQSSRAAWHAGAANGEKRRRFSGLGLRCAWVPAKAGDWMDGRNRLTRHSAHDAGVHLVEHR